MVFSAKDNDNGESLL